jgi:hypothetical protein
MMYLPAQLKRPWIGGENDVKSLLIERCVLMRPICRTRTHS